MPPNNPEVTVTLRSARQKANPQGAHGRAIIAGYSSLGTDYQVYTLRGEADLPALGNGEGIEFAAEIGSQSGYPVYFMPLPGTGQAPSAPVKTPASAGVPLTLYGSALNYGSAVFLGADHNGDILYKAKRSGVTIRHVVAGMSTPRTISVLGGAITVNVATDGGGAVANTETATSILASVLADVSAGPLIAGSIAGGGTGASKVAAVSVVALNNGAMELQALAAGVTVTFNLPTTANQALSVPVVTGTSVIVNLATDADKLPTSTAADVEAAILAQATAAALVTPTAGGTGLGLASALAVVSLDDGAVIYTPLTQTPTTIEHVVSGSSTALSVPPVVGNHVIVNVETDSAGWPISTPAAIAAAILAESTAAALVSAAAGGTGLGKAGEAVQTALQYGSTGALSVSGTSHDQHTIGVRITAGGTVGATGIAYEWTADNWVTTSSPKQLPTSGIISTLRDSKLDTNLVLTFTGVLETDDEWLFTAPKPVVAFADLQTAVDAIKILTSYKLGQLSTPVAQTRTQIGLIDATLQAVRNRMWLRYIAPTRDLNTGETAAQYVAAIANDFIGFESEKGLSKAVAGSFSHMSTYTGRNYRRSAVFQYVARRCGLAVHQDPMEKELGGLPNIRYQVDNQGVVTDPGINYDAYPVGALPSARIIAMRTWPGEPGVFYFNNSPTLADAADLAYGRVPYTDVIYECARIAQSVLSLTIGKSYRAIAQAESDLIPAGALEAEDAALIDNDVNEAVEAYLYSIKTDGNTSAGEMPPGLRPYVTRRDYSYAASDPKTVKGRLRIPLRGINELVELDVTPEF